MHILEPDIFSLIPPGVPWEINDQVYPKALNAGEKVLGFPVEGYWSDLGSPSRYLGTQKELLMREGTTPSPRIAAGAEVSPDSFIGPFVSIGDGCVIEAGVRN